MKYKYRVYDFDTVMRRPDLPAGEPRPLDVFREGRWQRIPTEQLTEKDPKDFKFDWLYWWMYGTPYPDEQSAIAKAKA